jgi:hypothetical protein
MTNINIKKKFLIIFLIALFLFLPKEALAIRYSLFAPSGTLSRGQIVTFTINIDTQGKTITSAKIGMTYQTQYLEYVNTIAGGTFPNLITEPIGDGKLIFSATSDGFNGSGVFAQVNFKIIADAPGETQLCVLWQVSPTPSPNPSPSPEPTSPPTYPSPTNQPTTPPQQPLPPQTNNPPRTTAKVIPTTGFSSQGNEKIILGSSLMVTFGAAIIILNSTFFNNQKRKFFSDGRRRKKSLQ